MNLVMLGSDSPNKAKVASVISGIKANKFALPCTVFTVRGSAMSLCVSGLTFHYLDVLHTPVTMPDIESDDPKWLEFAVQQFIKGAKFHCVYQNLDQITIVHPAASTDEMIREVVKQARELRIYVEVVV